LLSSDDVKKCFSFFQQMDVVNSDDKDEESQDHDEESEEDDCKTTSPSAPPLCLHPRQHVSLEETGLGLVSAIQHPK
jgi:hypothetical protein